MGRGSIYCEWDFCYGLLCLRQSSASEAAPDSIGDRSRCLPTLVPRATQLQRSCCAGRGRSSAAIYTPDKSATIFVLHFPLSTGRYCCMPPARKSRTAEAKSRAKNQATAKLSARERMLYALHLGHRGALFAKMAQSSNQTGDRCQKNCATMQSSTVLNLN